MPLIDTTFKEMAEKLMAADTVLVFPHVGIDGDSVGSSAAMVAALRKLGKKAYALFNEEIPEDLQFMVKDYFTDDCGIIANPDVALAVDCGEYKRFKDFEEVFKTGKRKLCIDHHGTSIFSREDGSQYGIGDHNIIEPWAAAAGELVYQVIEEMDKLSGGKLLPDLEIAAAIFASITTDTGNFQYSNTTALSHEIVAKFYDWGLKTYPISVELYENVRLSKLKIEAIAMSRLEILSGGKGAIAWVTNDDLVELDVKEGETDSIIKQIRSIRGVEYAAFLKEKEPGLIRVSLRAKAIGDVAGLAQKYEGGGHKKAAGMTLYMPLEDAKKLVVNELEQLIREL